jgi:uncharacterized protein (TIGR03435 family)
MMGLLGDHLWQSTIVAAIAGLLTLAFRRNRAAVRYWLWLTASVKFLVPFTVLMAIGARLGWRSATALPLQTEVAFIFDAVSQPFSQLAANSAAASAAAGAPSGLVDSLTLVFLAIWFTGFAGLLFAWLIRWRRVADAARAATPLDGRELAILRRLEVIVGIKRPIALRSPSGTVEPGVFGILRAVLLWPRHISEHLSEQQVEAIVAHEVCHVRRRDNLAAAVHMVVEAVFWFHPLVWWLGARLVDERERACDEEVVRLGSGRQVYADSILRTCEFYVKSPFECVAGVTGSDLKKRIEAIMRSDGGDKLNAWKKLLLVTTGAVTVAAPVVIGVLNGPQLSAQSQAAPPGSPAFEVASVKTNRTGDNRVMNMLQSGGRYTATNITLRMLIRNAYRLQDSQISSGPSWIDSDHYDVVAKGEAQFSLMLQGLLADRFKLTFHYESQELPIYALVVARSDRKLGSRLRQTDCVRPDNAVLPGPPDLNPQPPCGTIQTGSGRLTFRGAPMSQIATGLSSHVNRVVLDRTGLSGDFDLDLQWTADQLSPAAARPADPNGPSIVTALQEQLGLRLDSHRGPVEVLVIDSASQPTPD